MALPDFRPRITRTRQRGLSGFGAGSPFTPLSLNPALWLDASDTATITSLAGLVSQWNDKSGNSRHATQGIALNQPITGTTTVNGLNAIDFNGTNSAMALPAYFDNLSTKDYTIYIAFRPDTTAGTDTLFANEAAGNGLAMYYTSTAFRGVSTSFGTISDEVALSTTIAPHISMLRKNATEFRIFRDGMFGSSKVPSVGFTATFGTWIGASNNGSFNSLMDGRMCEVLIYEATHTEAQVNAVNNYLSLKWNIPVSPLNFGITDLPSFLTGRSTVSGFGDSITAGFAGPAQVNDRWLNLIAAKMGATLTNNGINSTPMQNTNRISTGLPFSNNGRDRYASTLTGGSKKDVVVILYGANDFGNTAETNWTRALFKSDYQEVITGLLGAGYGVNDIILCNVPYIRDYNYDAGFTGANSTIHEDYNLATRELAVTNGLRYADAYTKSKNRALISRVESDKLHPNESGNRFIAEAILEAVNVT
jgi:lysophospholipase L1-like esterase